MDPKINDLEKTTGEGESREENSGETKDTPIPSLVEHKRVKVTHPASKGAYERHFKKLKAENRTGDFAR